jgi:iron complex outermembrane receptor protein
VAITYIPAYRTWYQDATVYNRGPGQNINQYVKTPTDSFLTHEVRIRNTDNNSNLKWQAGFLYYDNTLSNVDNLFNLDPTILPPPLPALPPSYVFQSSMHKSTSAESGFAEATYSFVPETRLTVGVRYDHTQVRNDEDYTSILGITKSLTGDQGLRKFDDFTYKVRLEHDLTSRNMLYAMISTGASPGDVAITTDVTGQPEVLELKAETLTAYEIGSKNMFFGNRLQVNGDLYYNDYGAFQTAGIDITPNAPPPPIFATIAVPMTSYGAEFELKARPWENGTFSLEASYTNARYGSLGQYADLFSTKEVPGVAPFQGSVAYDHSLAIGGATLMLHGDVRLITAHDTTSIPQSWAALGAEPYVHVANQAIGDLNATLLFGSHYSITAYARNITDARFIPDGSGLEAVLPGPGPGAPPIIQAGRTYLSDPRTFGMILSFKY